MTDLEARVRELEAEQERVDELMRYFYQFTTAIRPNPEWPEEFHAEEGHVMCWDQCSMCEQDWQQGHAEGCLVGDLFAQVREVVDRSNKALDRRLGVNDD